MPGCLGVWLSYSSVRETERFCAVSMSVRQRTETMVFLPARNSENEYQM